jgi:23S rRNA pseudouridine1911/1915/1917 synthase
VSLFKEAKSFTAGEQNEGQRLDVFLSRLEIGVSRSCVKAMVTQGSVNVCGRRLKPSYRIKKGDIVEVFLKQFRTPSLVPEAIPLDVLYEDEDVIVVNKRAGMVVHPSRGQTQGTLVHALLFHCPEMALLGEERPGIVHRLDKGTSGTIVVAKNAQSLADLGRQFKDREVKKEYIALVHGVLSREMGKIEMSIGRHPGDRKRMSVVSDRGRGAMTEWMRLKVFRDFTLLKVVTRTGRTHQIRVHLSYLGHHVVGDSVYGGRNHNKRTPLIHRPALHASVLGFRHPKTLEWMEFQADLATDIQSALERIEELECMVDKGRFFG